MIEGIRLVEESRIACCRIDTFFYTEQKSDRSLALIKDLEDEHVRIEQVSENVMHYLSDTQSPQGILATIEIPDIAVPVKPDFILYLDSIRDPGNLGTILRTAAAVGVDAVFLSEDTVDPYSPKVLRSGMGAHFKIPIRPAGIEGLYTLTSLHKLQIIVADANQGVIYSDSNLRRPVVLLIGGEAAGAGSESRKYADEFIRIPMPGTTESLNAAVAAGILMLEVLRQRSQA